MIRQSKLNYLAKQKQYSKIFDNNTIISKTVLNHFQNNSTNLQFPQLEKYNYTGYTHDSKHLTIRVQSADYVQKMLQCNFLVLLLLTQSFFSILRYFLLSCQSQLLKVHRMFLRSVQTNQQWFQPYYLLSIVRM